MVPIQQLWYNLIVEAGLCVGGWLAGAGGVFLWLMPCRPAQAREVETKEKYRIFHRQSIAVCRRAAVPSTPDCFTRR